MREIILLFCGLFCCIDCISSNEKSPVKVTFSQPLLISYSNNLVYSIHILNTTNRTLKSVKIKLLMPDGLIFLRYSSHCSLSLFSYRVQKICKNDNFLRLFLQCSKAGIKIFFPPIACKIIAEKLQSYVLSNAVLMMNCTIKLYFTE